MNQTTLFDDLPDKPLPHNHTPTSRLAAKVMKPLAGKQLAKVFEFLKSQGPAGATDQEQQEQLKFSGDSQRPRRNRLVELGWVKDSGVMRMTKSGTPAKVWIVTDTAPELPTDSQKKRRGGLAHEDANRDHTPPTDRRGGARPATVRQQGDNLATLRSGHTP